MNLFYILDDYFVGDTGEVALPSPPISTAPQGLNCNGPRVFADCFPQRSGTDTHSIVSLFENGNNDEFVNDFAIVFGEMVSIVKDGATLTEISQPVNWPEGIEVRSFICW